MLVKAQIGRQRYSQQTDMVTSYYGLRTELLNWKTTVLLGKTVSIRPTALRLVRIELEAVRNRVPAITVDVLCNWYSKL